MILDFISSIFKPLCDTIDNVSTTDEERLKLRNELAQIQSNVQTKLIELEQAKLNAAQKVIVAETNSDSTIVKTWRPITTVLLVSLVILGAFKVIDTPPEIYKLLEGFLYIYGAGRSAEKGISLITSKLGK